MLATGIDMIEIERFQGALNRHGDRLLQRIFTGMELAEVGHKPASLAARFAAKEAAAKALGTGIGPVAWKEIEIRRGPAGEPVLRLHGSAARLAAERQLHTWSVSISHSQTHAIAMVVALGDGQEARSTSGTAS
ncbi:MAG: holo-ACP synthase [Chloroflexi bacterium]|jgi:holo-[acyl-carrier protein] synthase|nr:holo-ACP synthase [Chloroflexota bacterium]